MSVFVNMSSEQKKVHDAEACYLQELPARLVKRSQTLCRAPAQGGGRVNIVKADNVKDKDIVIVLHPTKTRKVTNLEGTVTELPAYVVFAREFSHVWKQKYGKKQSFDIMVPFAFAQARDEEHAYEIAHDIANEWRATRESEIDYYSTGSNEIPFSPEFMENSGMLESHLWNSLSK